MAQKRTTQAAPTNEGGAPQSKGTPASAAAPNKRQPSRPLVDATRQEITALRATLERFLERPPDAQLRSDLEQSSETLRVHLGQTADDLRKQLLRTDDELRQHMGGTADELRQRLGQTVDDLNDKLRRTEEELRRLSSSVDPATLGLLVTEATHSVTESALARTIKPALAELEEAYGAVDDQLAELRSFVAQFGPGGLPVLQQAKDFAEKRVAELEEELASTRGHLTESTNRVAELDAERQRRRLQSGMSTDELDRRLEELDDRDRSLGERETLQSETQRMARDLEGLRAELAHWKKLDLQEREHRSESNQLARLQAEVANWDEERAGLLSEVERARGRSQRVEQARDRLQREITALEEERAAAEDRNLRLEALEAQSGELSRTHEQDQRVLADLRTELVQTRSERDAYRRELDSARNEASLAEAEWRRTLEGELADRLAAYKGELQTWAERHAENQTMAVRDDLVRARAERDAAAEQRLRQLSAIEELRTELAGTRARLGVAEAENTALDASVSNRLEQLDADNERRLERLRQDLVEDLDDKRRRVLEAAEQTRVETEAEVEELNQTAMRVFEQIAEKRLELEEKHAEVATLTQEKKNMEARLDELRVRDVPNAERVGSLMRPWFAPEELADADAPAEDEWLEQVQTGLAEAGFTFHPRLVRAFHTSLKIALHAPLVVLAGISGTGKSELPRLYADLGGLPFQPLAVQPSWDSPHDLFGFFNYSDGRLKAEPLARILRQVGDVNDPLRASPSLVLLDEMNIARVEYYFAELLSKLEARRGVLGDPSDEARRRASVLLDAGPGAEPIPLYLDERVLFVGTMNEDESTLTLSDKVLDRACVLTFPAPRGMSLATQPRVPHRTRRLSWEQWGQWIQEEPTAGFVDRLNEINGVMEPLGRPFGHRLFRAIHAYLANYPGAAGDPGHAWSDQFAMKIIPRLRGLECGERVVRDGLDVLAQFVPDELKPSFDAARDREFFAWSGAAQIYRVDQ